MLNTRSSGDPLPPTPRHSRLPSGRFFAMLAESGNPAIRQQFVRHHSSVPTRRSNSKRALDGRIKSEVDANDVTIVAPGRQLLPHTHRRLATYRHDVDVGGGVMFETIWSDARYAVRSLRRTPGFTIAAVLTLALGIGGTTAIVSAVDAVLLRPLPYDDPDRVVTVWEDMRAAGNNAQMTPAPANYFDWASRNRVFEATAATAGATANITNSAPIVVINQTFAQRYWRNDNALGHRIALTSPGAEWMTIVGVVADVLETGYERGNRPGMYVLASQVRRAADNLVIRVDGDPLAVASATRRVIAGVDAEQPVGAVRTMDEIIDLEVVDRRGQSILLTAFAASALLLAAIGLYGPLSHLVAQQRREIGIRMALGATANGVTHAIVGRGLALTGAGLAAGVLAAGAGTGIMRNLLFGVQPNDPATFVVVTALLLTVSLIAIWIPARRATRVDPMIALRAE